MIFVGVLFINYVLRSLFRAILGLGSLFAVSKGISYLQGQQESTNTLLLPMHY